MWCYTTTMSTHENPWHELSNHINLTLPIPWLFVQCAQWTGDWNQLDSEMPEVFLLIKVAVRFGVKNDINNFLLQLIRMVTCIHSNDREIPDSSRILQHYNPELQGCAYYFTSHGGRIRDLPSYDITKTKPDIHDCCKSFPEAARSGTTYLFLWLHKCVAEQAINVNRLVWDSTYALLVWPLSPTASLWLLCVVLIYL